MFLAGVLLGCLLGAAIAGYIWSYRFSSARYVSLVALHIAVKKFLMAEQSEVEDRLIALVNASADADGVAQKHKEVTNP